MLNVTASDVRTAPFPHVISDTMLPPDLFRRLKADWPTQAEFDEAAAESGSTGSRAGKASGYDIYRGDSVYDKLLARSDAWREFDAWINSPAFIAKYQELFGQYAKDIGISVDIGNSAYDRDFHEPRAVLTQDATLKEKLGLAARKLTRGLNTNRRVALFTRLDITRGLSGYAKRPHTDRPNRLCSLIIYFVDAEESGLEGGALKVYQLKEPALATNSPRHPAPENVEEVAELTPKENLGIFFPCCNNSYHGVTAITSTGIPRDFLYINISGQVLDLW